MSITSRERDSGFSQVSSDLIKGFHIKVRLGKESELFNKFGCSEHHVSHIGQSELLNIGTISGSFLNSC